MNHAYTAQVLRTAELAHIIADFCAGDRSTLFNLSLTWRALREPATEVLWREVEAAELLRAIPDEIKEVIDIRDDMLYNITRQIQWPELQRFVRLARCIRAMHLNYIDSDPPDYTMLDAILRYWTPRPNWFPKLKGLSFEGEGVHGDHAIVHTLLRISAHRLETFRYCQGFLCYLPALSELLPYLHPSAGTLRALKAGQMEEEDVDLAGDAWDRWSDFIVSLHNPEEIEVEFPLNFNALKYLSASPNLTRLGFHISIDYLPGPNGHDVISELHAPTSFACLKALTIRVHNLDSYPALNFIGAVRSHLEMLHLEWTFYPRHADLSRVVDTISERLPTLEELTFSVHDTAHEERNDDDQEEDDTPFDASVLAGLFRLRHLRRLSIGMELGITPQFILSVAAAWPHLVSLDLHRTMYTEYKFNTDVGVIDLGPLADKCRSLQTLAVMLRGSPGTAKTKRRGRGEEMERVAEGLPVSELLHLDVHQSKRRLTRNDKDVLASMFPLAHTKYYK